MSLLRSVLSSPLRDPPISPLGGSTAEIITATVSPTLSALTDAQTPADGFTSGTYASTAGTISSETAVYIVNGSPELGTYDLTAGDVVQVREDVEDSESNTRSFWVGPIVVSSSFVPGAFSSAFSSAFDIGS